MMRTLCPIEKQLKIVKNAGAEALFVVCPPAPKGDSTNSAVSTKSADNSQKGKTSGNTDAGKTVAPTKSVNSPNISDDDQKKDE